MDTSIFKSSYSFAPKPPDNWSIKKYKRSDRNIDRILLKRWQNEAHLQLRDSSYAFLKAFCGSGKTIAARSIAAYKVYTSGKIQVFCVPKNDIGNDGFAGFCELEIPFGKTNKVLICDTPTNFCDHKVSSKIDALIDLMVNPPEEDDLKAENQISSSRQIVCTHQCLVLAYRKVKDDPYLLEKFIANKTFWIDEGHHIKGYEESKEEMQDMNWLGSFCNYILDSKNRHLETELFPMTATPYRGDYSKLFTLEQMRDFDLYSLDFLDHFPTLGINKIDVEFEEYEDQDGLFARVAKNIVKEPKNKHFVFVPPTGRKWRKKREDVDALFNAIYLEIMNELNVDLDTAKGMVLDLVTEQTQDFNDRLLRQEPKSGQNKPSRYTVVVCCMKCREGSDWCPADRLHNTSMETSPPLNFQTNGRLFRHFPGKNNVIIRYYVEKFKVLSNNKRDFVSDCLNAMLHYMLMDDLFNPIMVDIPNFVPFKKLKNLTKRKRTTLEEIFNVNYESAKKYLLNSMKDVFDFNDSRVNKIVTETIDKFLPNKEDYNKKHITEIKNGLKVFLLRARSGELRSKGIDISYVRKNGFDVIVEKHNLKGNMYAANLNQKEFERFREIVKKLEWTEEQKEHIEMGILRSVGVKNRPKLDDKGRYVMPIEKLAACHQIGVELKRFHIAYKKAYESSSGHFTVKDLAKELNLHYEAVAERVTLLNKILPKGYEFDFKKDSKLAAKLPIRDAA